MATCVWLRVNLPEEEIAALHEAAPTCEFIRLKDAEMTKQTARQIDAVFTEETLPGKPLRNVVNKELGY